MRRIIALLLLCLPLAVIADERILSFHSDVRVLTEQLVAPPVTVRVSVPSTVSS